MSPSLRDRVPAGVDGEVPHFPLVVGGTRVAARSGATYTTIDPYTGDPWATVPDAAEADVSDAVSAARRALEGPWGGMTGFERATLMRRLGDIVARDADELAWLETRDNGKLYREMRGQLESIPQWLSYFAGLADKVGGRTIPTEKQSFFVYTREEPVGVVGAILPWNSPLLLLMWKLAPALAAGCTMVVKPSDHTPVSTLAFASRVEEAGIPPGVFNVVTGLGPTVGKALASHPGVDKIAFTGSTAVGTEVAKSAADNVTGVLLELGGKSAHIVFDDADLDEVAAGVVAGVFAAAGQTCLAGSRLIVHRAVHDDLVSRVVARARRIRLGDPFDAETEMGPISNPGQFDRVCSLVDTALAEGAHVESGGRFPGELGGFFYEPTVLTGVSPTMTIANQEVFGPVLSVTPFDSEEEALAIANGTPFGLAGAVWTNDIRRAHRVAHGIRAGTVWINAYRLVSPAVPFGGFGLSGLGRENGLDAVREFTETKAIWVELGGQARDPFRLG